MTFPPDQIRWRLQLRMRSVLSAIVVVLSGLAGCNRSAPPAAVSSQIDAGSVENDQSNVGYIGSERCIACHRDAGASFLHTAHARALANIDVAAEPPDGEFDDPRTQRHYRVYRKDSALRHEESVNTESGSRLVLCDLPVRYSIGSGRFSRSYLVERHGFLYESPVTWFATPREWNLSPGYEVFNRSFQRPVEIRCIFCHAGRVEPVNRSPQRLHLFSLTIDCERCHGPGEKHARKWGEGHVETLVGPDETIFNPVKFDRQLGEDVCAQCHLHSAATVEVRGRNLLDFRPGCRLSDFVAHYASKKPKTQMQVVGHVEQLRISRCYQQDSRLTCLTCHDLHASPSKTPIPDYYRQKCLKCHTEQACTEPIDRRETPAIQNNCVHCHMPRGDTEIPHFAFTHHRIGIHRPETHLDSADEPAELVLVPGSPLSNPLDEMRNRGLGYLQLSDAPGQSQFAPIHHEKANELLRDVKRKGLVDPEVDAALARISLGVDHRQTLSMAQAVVAFRDASVEAWATACFTLGSTNYELNRPADARPWLERTVSIRPTGDVYMMLSDCCVITGDKKAAVSAARSACELAPDRPAWLHRLIELLRDTGDVSEADHLQPRFEALVKYRQRLESRP